MRYADEVVARDGLAPEDVEVAEREITMARQLIESLAVDHFEPEKFRDEYREQVLDLVERKAAGEEIVAQPAADAPAKVLDLVAALEASLEKAAGARDRHPSQAGGKSARDGAEPKKAKAAADKPTTVKAAKAAKAAKATKAAAKAPAKKTAARAKRSA
jgi:DNA end-binding protein Ku